MTIPTRGRTNTALRLADGPDPTTVVACQNPVATPTSIVPRLTTSRASSDDPETARLVGLQTVRPKSSIKTFPNGQCHDIPNPREASLNTEKETSHSSSSLPIAWIVLKTPTLRSLNCFVRWSFAA